MGRQAAVNTATVNILSWTKYTEVGRLIGTGGLLSTEQPGKVTCDLGSKDSTSLSTDKLGADPSEAERSLEALRQDQHFLVQEQEAAEWFEVFAGW